MAERPSPKLQLWLSIATAVFSFYQWFDTQRQQRISAAIEFSKDYLHDPEMVSRYAKLLDYDPKMTMSNEEMLKERSFIDLLNYIASLAKLDLIEIIATFPGASNATSFTSASSLCRNVQAVGLRHGRLYRGDRPEKATAGHAR